MISEGIEYKATYVEFSLEVKCKCGEAITVSDWVAECANCGRSYVVELSVWRKDGD